MTEAGRLFEQGDCFVPGLLMAARATKEVFDILRPLLSQTGVKPVARVVLDYFTDERMFLEDNLRAIRAFPRAIFLPGFWSEYGMCTEPSAFGSVSVFEQDEFPFAKKVLRSPAEVDRLEAPNPRKDGLLPFVIKRLQHLRPEIEAAGHQIRFAVARGPLNIATFLMGTTEFLTALKTDPERMHRLLQVATDYLVVPIANLELE
jgi:uroporphyrinogen decarboxylase